MRTGNRKTNRPMASKATTPRKITAAAIADQPRMPKCMRTGELCGCGIDYYSVVEASTETLAWRRDTVSRKPVMNATLASVRLLVFGSTFWIAFWSWKYVTQCIRSPNGTLFCPTADDGSLLRTDNLHAACLVFGAPLVALILGLFFRWAIRRIQIRLDTRQCEDAAASVAVFEPIERPLPAFLLDPRPSLAKSVPLVWTCNTARAGLSDDAKICLKTVEGIK